MKKNRHIFLIAFWIGLSLFFMAFSYKYGLGELNNPGPGLLPFLVATLLLLFSSFLILRSFFESASKNEVVKEEKDQFNRGRIILVFVSLFVYAFLLEMLGYLIDTFLLLVLLFWCTGIKRWSLMLILSGLTVFGTYFLFNYLEVRFPMGIINLIFGG